VTTADRTVVDGLAGLSALPGMGAIVMAHCLVVSLTSLSRLAGILGGLCWIGRALLDDGSVSASVIDALHYGGLALLVIALLGIGGGLVSGLVALRVVVAICLVALAAAVLSFLHQQYSDRSVDGIVGGLMVLYCVIGILARRSKEREGGGDEPEPRRSTGSHAA
jgi:F0F1-type ATP synthase assembly protein I